MDKEVGLSSQSRSHEPGRTLEAQLRASDGLSPAMCAHCVHTALKQSCYCLSRRDVHGLGLPHNRYQTSIQMKGLLRKDTKLPKAVEMGWAGGCRWGHLRISKQEQHPLLTLRCSALERRQSSDVLGRNVRDLTQKQVHHRRRSLDRAATSDRATPRCRDRAFPSARAVPGSRA